MQKIINYKIQSRNMVLMYAGVHCPKAGSHASFWENKLTKLLQVNI